MKYNTKAIINGVAVLSEKKDSSPSITNVEMQDSVSDGSFAIGSVAINRLTLTLLNGWKMAYDGDIVELWISKGEEEEQGTLETIEEEVGTETEETPIDDESPDIEVEEDAEEEEAITEEEESEAEVEEAELNTAIVSQIEGESEEPEEETTEEEEEATWQKVGTFFVYSQKAANEGIQLTCYDSMIFLVGTTYTPAEADGTVQEHFDAFRTACLEETGITVEEFTFSDPFNQDITWSMSCDYRDALGYFAGIVGGFAHADEDGEVGISFYLPTDEILLKEELVSYKETSAGEILLDGLTCNRSTASGLTTDTISTGAGQAVSWTNPYVTEEMLASIYEDYRGIRYTGASVSARWDTRLDAGTLVRVMTEAEAKNWFKMRNAYNQSTDADEKTTILTNMVKAGRFILIGTQVITFGGEAISTITSASATETAKENEMVSPWKKAAIEVNDVATEADAKAETATKEVEKVNQHFWYDADGAHVQGDKENPTYRTDIKDVGMSIVDISGAEDVSVAEFGTSGVQIGKTENAHQNLDYHSWKITDKEGDTFAEIGDLRNEDGIATVEDVFFGDGTTKRFRTVLLPIERIISVTIDGKETTAYTEYKLVDNVYGIDLNETITYKNKLIIKYETKDTAAKSYTLGKRDADGSCGGYSTVEGYENIASGYCSHAEGGCNVASGNWSHAEGYMTEASGAYSHAEGFRGLGGIVYKTKATGHASHAEGNATEANGFGAHSEGHQAIADGDYSHAEGEFTEATGEASHASGYGTTAGYDHQLVCGTYNQNKADSLFEVGNGESIDGDEIYSNAFRVDKNGDIYARNSIDPIGTVYSATKTVGVSGTNINTYTTGATITVPGGTYVITGQWTFEYATTSGSRNIDVDIMVGSKILARSRVVSSANNYAVLNASTIETFTGEKTSIVIKGSSSKKTSADTQCWIKAIKIC